MRRWLWWLGPPLLAIALLLHFAPRSVAIKIAGGSGGGKTTVA